MSPYRKFAYRTTRTTLGQRWKEAFQILRKLRPVDRLVFVGYSMPPTDLEAKGLFNYTGWYNSTTDLRKYGYPIVVVNPDVKVPGNYSFFRNLPRQHSLYFANWVAAGMPI